MTRTQAIGGMGAVWWLEEAMAGAREAACPPLAGTARADVCVVGGGYAGLWTAIEIREQAPDVSVVLIDREGCGFGASGRNGGWARGWHTDLPTLAERFGAAEGVRLAERSTWAIGRIESFCGEHGIDCGFRRAGAVKMARLEAQARAWEPALEACRRAGRESLLERVDGAELRERTGSPLPLAGLRQTDAAAVQPALLARGLRRAAVELGVRVHEGTPMIRLLRGRPSVVLTPAGRIEAGTVVLALGAWSGAIGELRRATVPIGSHIVATEPLGERVSQLGWARGELFGDSRLMVHYAQVTRDGRIVFGRGGGAIGAAGRVLPAHFHDPATVASIARDFGRWFPSLRGVRFTHAWGGPVDRAPEHMPFTGRLSGDGDVLYGLGFSGNGVAPSALIGRILGRQALGVEDPDTRSPLTAGPPSYLPPEPLRSAGGAVVRKTVELAEKAEEHGVRVLPRALLDRLTSVSVPRALEPRRRR